MPRNNDNTMMKYAKAIKEYCKERTRCEGCVFANEEAGWGDDWCPFIPEENPCNWKFKE